MPRDPHRWDPVCPRPRTLVRPVPVDPVGVSGPTPNQARGPRWRRTTPGLFVPAGVPDDLPEQRILEQSLRLPPSGAITGWAACRWWRAGFFDGLAADGVTRLPVPLAIGGAARIRSLPGSVLLRGSLPADDVALVHGVRCARRARALFDAMRTADDLRSAVVAMDMMAAAGGVSVRQMRKYAAEHSGWTGARQVRAALELASERSRSPNETRLRLVWVLDAGLPPPLVNQEVWDLDGRLLGVADLLDAEAGVVGEFNGADHRTARRQTRDAEREDLMRRAGLEYLTVTGLDLRDPDRVVDRILSTRARALALPRPRGWTLRPPPGWLPEPTLDEVFAARSVVESTSGRWTGQVG